MKKLFVGNLNFQTTESELRALFEPFGEIGDVHIATDRNTGRARGFAFVELNDDESAEKAIAALNGKDVNGRALNVNEARPKTPGGGGGSRGGGFRDEHRGGGFGGGRQRREPRW